MANPQNLIPNSARTPSERRANATKAGKASGEARRAKKTFAEIVQDWADREPSDVDKAKLAKLGIVGEQATNKMMLLVPLLANVSSGNTKSLELVIQLLNEDKEKDARIKQMEAETEKLKLENEQLRKDIDGVGKDYEDLTPLAILLRRDGDADCDD